MKHVHVSIGTFTKEQIAEQIQFTQDLDDGKADISFQGSRLEAMAFLNGLGMLCGR